MQNLELMDLYNMSPEELTFVQTLLLAQDGQMEYIKKWIGIPENTRGAVLDLLKSLQEKGVINKSYKLPEKGQMLDPIEIEFNKNFVKKVFRLSYDMGKELFDIYPMFITIHDCTYPLRTVTKKFNTIEDMFIYYARSIHYNMAEHDKIIELVKWAKDNTNFLCFNISEFVISHKWEEIEAIKTGEGGNNYNFNAVKQL